MVSSRLVYKLNGFFATILYKYTYLMTYNNKKRPNTWNAVSPTKKTPSISRVKRSKSQQKKRASRSSTITNNRHTITTISTLTFSSKNSLHWQHNYQQNQQEQYEKHQHLHSVFHTQSLLFLFGFLFFPFWWIGGYYSTCIRSFNTDIETTTIIIHPSMIANGKTSSKLFQLPHNFSRMKEDSSIDEILFFYKWNRYMSIFSIFLLLLVISMLIWYLTLF